MPASVPAAAPIDLDEIYRRQPASPSILVADGYGIDIRVHRGHLQISDGIGATRRHRQISRAQRTVKRLVILGDTGSVSLDAIRWCADLGITVVQVDRDGRPLLVAGPPGRDDARLRRAQAVAETQPVGVEITRYLLGIKLTGHADILRNLLDLPVAADRLGDHLAALDRATTLDACREIEAQAANLYFGGWTGTVTVRWASRDLDRVPDHWHAFSVRRTPLQSGHTPRNAADPINAFLNYATALAEVECRTACLILGLDPGLGISHRARRHRDSFALDLLEAIRPTVETTVLQLLQTRHFRWGDFRETRDGVCRVLPPLTHDLADCMPDWARALAPHAEHVARLFGEAADGKVSVRTPLSGANYRNAQDRVRMQRRQHRIDQTTRPAGSCRDCGTPLTDRKRQLCETCWPVARRKLAADRAAAGRALRAAAGHPPITAEAASRKAASQVVEHAARAAWNASGQQTGFDRQHLTDVVIPGLADVPLGAIQAATGLSVSACSKIRSGTLTPHARHWQTLATLMAGPVTPASRTPEVP